MPAESQPTDLPAAEPMPVRGPGPSHPAVDRVASALAAEGLEPGIVWFDDAVTTARWVWKAPSELDQPLEFSG